jgi:fermentation-respiration switch protein FrsA (DUF1100 family)
VLRRLLNSLLYFPEREIVQTPGVPFSDVTLASEDGERLHGWWVPARRDPIGHVLLCHGNAGNVGDRVPHVELLSAAGFDVLAFDYRGYGRSSGRPDEEGSYRDARAARRALLGRSGIDTSRLIYLGESLGAAVALALACEHPPAGVALQSAFTSIRAMARLHYPAIPEAVVPDAYPSLDRIRRLRAPLLLLHGDRDDVVPLAQGEALFAAAPEPKRMHIFQGAGHGDLVRPEWARVIAAWAATCLPRSEHPRGAKHPDAELLHWPHADPP